MEHSLTVGSAVSLSNTPAPHHVRRASDVKARAIAEAKEALIQAVEAEQDLENRYQGNFSLPEMRAAREARRQAVDALRKARQS